MDPRQLAKAIAQLLGGSAHVEVVEHEEHTPTSVVPKLYKHLKGLNERGIITASDVDAASDLCLLAADFAFRGEIHSGDEAARALLGVDDDYEIASNNAYKVSSDAFMAALIKMGLDDPGIKVTADDKGHAFLEAAQILAEALAELTPTDVN